VIAPRYAERAARGRPTLVETPTLDSVAQSIADTCPPDSVDRPISPHGVDRPISPYGPPGWGSGAIVEDAPSTGPFPAGNQATTPLARSTNCSFASWAGDPGGYYEVAADCGVVASGDAPFLGSAMGVTSPVVGLDVGSLGGAPLTLPIVGMD